MSEIRRASRLLARAVESEASTTDERIPMIAITTRSSIRVKPLEPLIRFFDIYMFAFWALPIIPYFSTYRCNTFALAVENKTTPMG
jgi:hypothetical protein